MYTSRKRIVIYHSNQVVAATLNSRRVLEINQIFIADVKQAGEQHINYMQWDRVIFYICSNLKSKILSSLPTQQSFHCSDENTNFSCSCEVVLVRTFGRNGFVSTGLQCIIIYFSYCIIIAFVYSIILQYIVITVIHYCIVLSLQLWLIIYNDYLFVIKDRETSSAHLLRSAGILERLFLF